MANGGGTPLVIPNQSAVPQTNHRLLCEALGKFLANGAQAGRSAAGGIGSPEWRVVVTLYSLLKEHPIDREGRCRSCRWPGSVVGLRWQPCWVYGEASLCLQWLDDVSLFGLLPDE
jgi:hypothetical protein